MGAIVNTAKYSSSTFQIPNIHQYTTKSHLHINLELHLQTKDKTRNRRIKKKDGGGDLVDEWVVNETIRD